MEKKRQPPLSITKYSDLLADALRRACDARRTSVSEYLKMAVVKQLREDGFQPFAPPKDTI